MLGGRVPGRGDQIIIGAGDLESVRRNRLTQILGVFGRWIGSDYTGRNVNERRIQRAVRGCRWLILPAYRSHEPVGEMPAFHQSRPDFGVITADDVAFYLEQRQMLLRGALDRNRTRLRHGLVHDQMPDIVEQTFNEKAIGVDQPTGLAQELGQYPHSECCRSRIHRC